MAIFSKKKDDPKKEYKGSLHNTQEENDLLNEIDTKQTYAEGGVRTKIEIDWDDEYKICQGGGKQWDTSKGVRTQKGKKRNFNSETNLVSSMIQNMLAPFTSTPNMEAVGVESGDDEAAETINDLIISVFYRNKFPEQYEKMVSQMIKYGPMIGEVSWDQHRIGGSGPDRWVGEVGTLFVKKDEFFPDPAILDLEERLQECSYINRKQRKKLAWLADTWEKGKYVIEDSVDIPKNQEEEGQDPQQATLIAHFHKGTPKFISDEWKREFLKKADQADAEGMPYKAKDFRDMATGTLKGVHCAYKANTVLLDYVPYIYEDGLYPFVYKVLYSDEEQPWGMGEIRNNVIPQVLYNRADEIELGAMLRQGLGKWLYTKGGISPTQRDELLDNFSSSSTLNEVTSIHEIKQMEPVQVPANITNYKNSKKDMIDTISGNTAILQGISVGANVPHATIKELGARADARTRRKAKVIERFMIEFTQLIINRIIQNYTNDRKYRILGDRQTAKVQTEAYKTLQQIASMPQGTPPEQQLQALVDLLKFIKTEQQKPKTGKYDRSMLVKTWNREEIKNENGEVIEVKKEEFMPEFDLYAKVTDDRPTDRDYYVSLATSVLGTALGVKNFWKIIDEGKLPPVEEILKELDEMQKAQAEAAAQAQQTAMQMQQQEKELDKQTSLEKIDRQNQSMEKQVAMSAMAKAGTRA